MHFNMYVVTMCILVFVHSEFSSEIPSYLQVALGCWFEKLYTQMYACMHMYVLPFSCTEMCHRVFAGGTYIFVHVDVDPFCL